MKHNGGNIFTGQVAALLLAILASGCGPKAAHLTASVGQADYIADASAQSDLQQAGEGSLWVAQGRYSNLYRDFKARQVNDILTILVSETTQANAAADATNNKQSTAQIGFDNLFGAEKKITEVTSGVSGSGSTTFKGSGSTMRASTLSTTVAARVKSVLPNGYLVIEGIREIRLNNENQTIYLTGIVRPEDISARNVVLSGSIAQMEVRVQGRGIVSQPLNPGWLYRILSGIFPF